eukprot:Gregarina_sp_Pseudo_9__1086@NODE_1707_length_1380_cov_237_475019_g1582_i0_p1_GENE_NODE_1707_length_1380_cov_237_475019_g1582_i0NODE_1707_length_1380_cov_237_475019_g1582_i0_p1_ORF_typecomplete_len186_score12_99Acetyltransf_1/PF00583_25/1_3e11Acetyltransf_10/PF13673_7/2_7e10Acetyltransf_7/PF13508_7/1_8e07Acetyltransf_3/PF13302_7/2e06Acetyltransf_4/PF13420_7/3_4e06GNAT_acetyltran/PF12746_7/0_00067FR47/PF08445_10/0_0023Acetyltransf_8/PF13523_6/0_042Acetyltransf_9/PF13527_7/0_059_NODE_1707_length_13
MPVGRTASSLSTAGSGSASSLAETSKALNFAAPTLPSCQLEAEDNKSLLCRPMKAEDYAFVRAIMPQVSRCNQILSQDIVVQMLDCTTFFPYVVCHDETVIGYAELHRLPHFGRGFDGRLEKVLILEEYRGQKIAQKFCSFLCDVARNVLGCGRIDLTVEKPAAKAVYSNLGFSKVDTEVWRTIF